MRNIDAKIEFGIQEMDRYMKTLTSSQEKAFFFGMFDAAARLGISMSYSPERAHSVIDRMAEGMLESSFSGKCAGFSAADMRYCLQLMIVARHTAEVLGVPVARGADLLKAVAKLIRDVEQGPVNAEPTQPTAHA